jgi:hypothetical protein
MDAFYTALEERYHPELRDRQVVVGADPKAGANARETPEGKKIRLSGGRVEKHVHEDGLGAAPTGSLSRGAR